MVVTLKVHAVMISLVVDKKIWQSCLSLVFSSMYLPMSFLPIDLLTCLCFYPIGKLKQEKLMCSAAIKIISYLYRENIRIFKLHLHCTNASLLGCSNNSHKPSPTIPIRRTQILKVYAENSGCHPGVSQVLCLLIAPMSWPMSIALPCELLSDHQKTIWQQRITATDKSPLWGRLQLHT